MQKVFGKSKVEEGLDIRKGLHYDLRNKKVYEAEKKRAKSRCTFLDHWSPPCTTNTRANRSRIRRWKDESYGRCQDADLMQDTVVQVRVENLCEMKHLVGDYFIVEHIWPTTMVQMDCFQRLLSLPGVFMVVFDNCAYGELYRHRQVLITNLPIMAQLSRNCQDLPTHKHAVIGEDLPTGAVSPFSQSFCDQYVGLVKRAVNAKTVHSACVHCIGAEKFALGAAASPAHVLAPNAPDDVTMEELLEMSKHAGWK
jgi:hypothetical protein